MEDRAEDAELNIRELRRTALPCETQRVDNERDFRRALGEFSPQVVLADYTVPGFGGMRALEILQREAPAIPLIIVTGSLDEETAAECIKGGAADYVLKTNLARLGPAIRAALTLADSRARSRTLEAQLLESQKMEAVGRLAGGVAHDFNNILTAIGGYTDLLLADLPEGDPRREDVEEIYRAAQRAAALTQQLLAFSRRQVLQPRVLDLNALVVEIEKMLRRLIGEDILFATVLHPNVGNVRADPSQLEQVIVNLAVNARDAMPEGGHLTLETRNIEITGSEGSGHPAALASGRYVLLSVSDTGVGMSADTKARIFEPFFTTKARGKGTGLGLATVYGIVQQTGGHILPISEPGRGTTMRLYLPRVDAPIDPVERPEEGETASLRGSETILLVEDEASVRAVTRQLLTRNGYQVLESSDGRAAMALVRATGTPHIDLLLTDVVMPGMSGRELADTLLAELPHVRVLFMSGYTDDAVVRHGMLEPGLAYIEKPWRPAMLLRKIRDTLGRRMSGPRKIPE